jgi:serpin B
VANSLWPQQGYPFLDEYLALLRKHYGVAITAVDYQRAAEEARTRINDWVAAKTEERIQNLIPPGILDGLTRLVLVNAIYFKGKWQTQFKEADTQDDAFRVAAEQTVQAPMMSKRVKARYASQSAFDILELPYVGGEVALVVLLPKEIDGLQALEAELSAENVARWLDALTERDVFVFLPRFQMTSRFRLDKTLAAMGMADAFREIAADFSGMDGQLHWLYIGAVLHQAFVEVNEEGTEAAAATAVVMETKAMPVRLPIFRADHPFVFLIRENRTGSILFAGRLVDPTKTGE